MKAFPANEKMPEGYDEDDMSVEPIELDDPDLLQNRPPVQRAVVISAGVIANLVLTFSLAAYTAGTTGLNMVSNFYT